ncbi:MAG: DUF748 domain-containing protein [Bdellovibrionota bacterium]
MTSSIVHDSHFTLFEKRSTKIVLGLIVFLVALRIALPYILKDYINHVLKDQIDGYTGHIEDLNLALWRGAYRFEGLVLQKVEKKVPVPFIEGRETDFSLSWSALFKGSVVGRVTLDGYKINFVNGPTQAETQAGVEGEGWQKTVDNLFPLDIEDLRVRNSSIHFRDFSRKPEIDLQLAELQGEVTNLTNANKEKKELVSSYAFSSTVQKDGALKIKGGVSLLEKNPTFDLNLEMRHVNLVEFSDFAKTYARFDIGTGRLDVFAEAASADGKIKGYVKPLLTNVKILAAENQHDDSATLSDVIISTANLIVRRYSKDESAAKIPFEGELTNPKIKIWDSIKSSLGHAFGKEIQAKNDDEITLKSAKKVKVTPGLRKK